MQSYLLLLALFIVQQMFAMEAPEEQIKHIKAGADTEFVEFTTFETETKRNNGQKFVRAQDNLVWGLLIAKRKSNDPGLCGVLRDAKIQSLCDEREYNVVAYLPRDGEQLKMYYREQNTVVGNNHWVERNKSLLQRKELLGLLLGWGTAISINTKRFDLDTTKVAQASSLFTCKQDS